MPSDVHITGIHLADGASVTVDYQLGVNTGSLDLPMDVFTSLVQQMLAQQPAHAPNLGHTTGTSSGRPPPAASQPRKKGVFHATSQITEREYDVFLIVDSLMQVTSNTEAGVEKVTLPIDILKLTYKTNQVFAGGVPEETSEVYIDFKTWSFWFDIAQHYDFRVVLMLFATVIAGLVFIPFQLRVNRDKRARASLEGENELLTRSRTLLIEAQERERKRLANELHDVPVQTLLHITRGCLLPLAKQVEQGEQRVHVDAAQEMLNQVEGELRNICTDLLPPILVHFGLDEALRDYGDRFRKRNPDLQVTLELDVENKLLPEMTRLALYRISQEAMNNVARHAQAQHVKVTFRLDEKEVELRVEDDGKGFVVPRRWIDLEAEGHLGLSGIAMRAEGIGGSLEVASVRGQGTCLRVRAPRPARQNGRNDPS